MSIFRSRVPLLRWTNQCSCTQQARPLYTSSRNLQIQGPNPSIGPNLTLDTDVGDEANSSTGGGARNAFMDAAMGTAVGVLLIGLGGVAYHNWYKWDVLRKIAIAFEPGYDPVLELDRATHSNRFHTAREDSEAEGELHDAHLRRSEQGLVDRIIDGKEVGHYYLLLGAKGVGKSSMIIDAMRKNQADGVAVMEAHEDPEIFRLRLGKCLNFEFNEDYYGGLFSRKDPRDAGPLLDIERVLNKLETRYPLG